MSGPYANIIARDAARIKELEARVKELEAQLAEVLKEMGDLDEFIGSGMVAAFLLSRRLTKTTSHS